MLACPITLCLFKKKKRRKEKGGGGHVTTYKECWLQQLSLNCKDPYIKEESLHFNNFHFISRPDCMYMSGWPLLTISLLLACMAVHDTGFAACFLPGIIESNKACNRLVWKLGEKRKKKTIYTFSRPYKRTELARIIHNLKVINLYKLQIKLIH